MRVSPWCLLPLHHIKDLPVRAVVRARHRRKYIEVVAYSEPGIGTGIGGEQLQLQGGNGGGMSLVGAILLHCFDER